MYREVKHNHNNESLHKYVLICVGCLFLFLASFPYACWRVSQSNKFDGLPFQSLTKEAHQKFSTISSQ